jgi:hypothetical protein
VGWGGAEAPLVAGYCAGEWVGLGWLRAFDGRDPLVEPVLVGFELLIVFDQGLLCEILFGGFHSADDSQQANVLLCVSFF